MGQNQGITFPPPMNNTLLGEPFFPVMRPCLHYLATSAVLSFPLQTSP
jgi:hypothetical protein